MDRIPYPVYYYLSYLITPLLGLIQTKFLTIFLSTQGFAEIQLMLPLLGWGVILGGLGAPQFVIRFYANHNINGFVESLTFTVVFITALFIVAYGLLLLSNAKIVEINIYVAVLFLAALLLAHTFAMTKALLRVQEEHIYYNVVVILERILGVSGVLLGVYLFTSAPVKGFLVGSIVATSTILVFIYTTFYRRQMAFAPSFPDALGIRNIFLYGFPIVSVLLLNDFLSNLNRYIIAYKLTATEVSSFVIGNMISVLAFQSLYEPLLTYIQPRIFKAWEQKESAKVESMTSNYLQLYIVMGILMLGLCIRYEDLLFRIVANKQYQLPEGCFVFLIFSSFVIGIYRFLVTHYLIKKNTSELIVCFFISLLITISGSMLLIGSIKLKGVSISVLLGSVMLTVIVWFRGRHTLRIRLLPRKLYIYLILAGMLCTVHPFSDAAMRSYTGAWTDMAFSIFLVSLGALIYLHDVKLLNSYSF